VFLYFWNMKNLFVTRKLLYDGEEKNMPQTFSIFADSKQIELKSRKSFSDLSTIISTDDFDYIASHLTTEQYQGITLYKVNDIEAYYTIEDNYIVIFTFGETQPGRYKLYLESVWEKD
jgi:hypothetical protein